MQKAGQHQKTCQLEPLGRMEQEAVGSTPGALETGGLAPAEAMSATLMAAYASKHRRDSLS